MEGSVTASRSRDVSDSDDGGWDNRSTTQDQRLCTTSRDIATCATQAGTGSPDGVNRSRKDAA